MKYWVFSFRYRILKYEELNMIATYINLCIKSHEKYSQQKSCRHKKNKVDKMYWIKHDSLKRNEFVVLTW